MTEPSDTNVILTDRLCTGKILQTTRNTEFFGVYHAKVKKNKTQHTEIAIVSRLSKKMALSTVNATSCELD